MIGRLAHVRLGQTRYQLLDVLGHGAAGVVHLARDRTTRRYVAAKVLQNPSRDELVRLRFLAEQNLSIEHPNVLRTIDWYQGPDQAVLIMELADAGNVAQLLALNPTLPKHLVERICHDALVGLAHLHGAGVIHRDLTPSNVMLCLGPDSDVVGKVGDLGVAILEGRPRLTQDASVVGTVGYIPPEVLAGGDHDERSDLWALGRTLEALAERSDPPVGDGLRSTLDAMTATDRAKRPAGAAAASRAFVPGVEAPGGSTAALPLRARNVARRHRRRVRVRQASVVVAAAAIALTVANIGSGPTTPEVAASIGTTTTAPTTTNTSTTAPTTTTTTTAALPTTTTTAPIPPELRLADRNCRQFGIVTAALELMWRQRREEWESPNAAAAAFGAEMTYSDVITPIQQLLLAGTNIPGQELIALGIGKPDEPLARAFIVEALVSAGAEVGGVVDRAAAREMTRVLVVAELADVASPIRAEERWTALAGRLSAIDQVIDRFVAGGCGADPRPVLPMSVEARAQVFAQPLTTVDDFFGRLDRVRPPAAGV